MCSNISVSHLQYLLILFLFMISSIAEAVLEYRIAATAQTENGPFSLADITLHTGRTHQIRVQFASRKHPLWGDGKYGSRCKGAIALQSAHLRFLHPTTGEPMEFHLVLPEEAPWKLD